ncbi:IS21 family transposase [Pimelobacter simplex]|uniref:IS21 family transposase n=1 Tax=Nocardioides simplex TaxID=2045 RepID=UPI00214F7A54|nr:IS21 family transposase [Pimelobacter simplex]UUW92756.1 IS21 family transposase [Pimelobacter simplex]UUW98727.1 IS21 family transposase [Pimelobacter simplex]
MKNAKERMDVIAAYRDVGTYRGAAEICGTTHKTVKRIIEAHELISEGGFPPERVARAKNFDEVAELVAASVKKTAGKISAKRLLPAARTAGYEGSDRNFRRLVAAAKSEWRRGQARAGGRRPAIWSPGEVLAIDWGEEVIAGRKVHVFCAVLAWSRFRFVRFAADEQQATTLAMLAECFEVLGGVPKVVLADRMGCLKGGVVANVVVPAPDYVRFATHYRFRPDFCHGADPESKGIVENLVGYAKDDLLVPFELDDDPWAEGLAGLNIRAVAWCEEVNSGRHSEICEIPAERLESERELLADLPSLRLEVGPKPITRKVDKLSCIRFGSARYSVPNRLIGTTVTVLVDERDRVLRVIEPITGELHAEHQLVAPGETSIVDAHYDRPRPDTPRRGARPRTAAEREFLALGPAAEQFLVGAAAAGVTKLNTEIGALLTLGAAHGHHALAGALERAVAFGRWRADDVRSILATNGHAPRPTAAGQALVMTLPTVPTRSLDAYRIDLDAEGGEGA